MATRRAVRILYAESCETEHDVHFGCGSMTGMLSVDAFCIPTDPECLSLTRFGEDCIESTDRVSILFEDRAEASQGFSF